MKLNLGSGGKPFQDYINVDINHTAPGVNIIHDLNDYPWPFKTESVDGVIMSQ